jgi:hypothetical protein
LLVEQQVLGLEISVANSDFVDVLDARNNLLEEFTSFIFLQALSFDDIVEEFSSARILHDEEQLARSFDNFVQLDNVRVPHDFQNVDFPCNSLDIALVFDFVFFKYFDSNLFACDQVGSQPDFSEGALPKRAS